MKNKKGFGLLWLIVIAGLIAIVASILGIVFIRKFVDAIGSKTLTWIAVVTLLIVFRQFIDAILMSVWGVLKRILGI